MFYIFFFKQKTAYEMRISDWSSDVCSSDLCRHASTSCRKRENRTARSRPRPRQDRRKAAGSCPDFPQSPAPARRCAWPYRIGRGRPCNKKQKYAVGILCLSRLSGGATPRAEEQPSELQSLMRIVYAVFCLKNKTQSC